MATRVERSAGAVVLEREEVAVEIGLRPFSFSVHRSGRRLIGGGGFEVVEGSVHDRFIQLTEGVVASERPDPPERLGFARPLADPPLTLASADGRAGPEPAAAIALAGELTGGRGARIELALEPGGALRVRFSAEGSPLRLTAGWDEHPGERFVGLGARHGNHFDQSGRSVQLGADRSYTGPDCPPEMLDVGGIPQGDYAPVPWLISSAGYAVWARTYAPGTRFELHERIGVSTRAAAGPLELLLLTDPTPAARLRRYCALTGFPALLPEWGYGHWKSRDVYEHQDDIVDDFEGYQRNELPLDAIVIDSPWETQYNTWRFNPYQFPDAPGLIARMRADGVRTVVWVTPWVNLESVDGQRPPGPESERLHREPAPNYAEGAAAGHFVKTEDGEPFVARWWMGTGSPVDFSSPAADDWWRAQARGALELGVEGIKADDGEGYYFPDGVRFADGSTGASGAWAHGLRYRRSMQRALDEVHPGRGVLFGRSGWSGEQALGMLWGGDQASDFWSLQALVTATLAAAASGFSNWSHDVGGYLGERLASRCPKELLLRWVQFGCFTPLMQAHGRFPQEAWTYDPETLEIYRKFVLLHERLVPYVRAAAATAARCGLPIIRPLCLTDPADPRGYTIPDAYGYGPALWVAPVLERGARERELELPRGDWIDYWSGERVEGGRFLVVDAPLGRIPVFVRSGSLVVTYPAQHVAAGLGDADEAERPLEATLWGEPELGRAGVRLADETRIRWHAGAWSVDPPREVSFRER